MKHLISYEIRFENILKIYDDRTVDVIPYDFEEELNTLKELKNTASMLVSYNDNLQFKIKKETIKGLLSSVVALYFTTSYISEPSLLKMLVAISFYAHTFKELYELKDDIFTKNNEFDKGITITYKSKLIKLKDITSEKTIVSLELDDNDFERKHLEHLKYLRNELETEKLNLQEDNTYQKEYKII